jgi:hypothetical protein
LAREVRIEGVKPTELLEDVAFRARDPMGDCPDILGVQQSGDNGGAELVAPPTFLDQP